MSLLSKSYRRLASLHHIVRYSSSSIISNSDPHEIIFKCSFSNEEQCKVLKILNYSNRKQLSQFNVSLARIKNLESWRNKKGPFKSLNDVLEVEGLGEKVLEKICSDIIQDNVDPSKILKTSSNKRTKSILTPSLPTSLSKEIESAVGIHLGSTGVSWAKLTGPTNKLTNWNFQNFANLPNKLLAHETFELAVNIINKLPSANVFVFEASSNMSPKTQTNQATVSTYNQNLELASMLLALINTNGKLNGTTENCVFHLRSKLPARLFRTLVGNERVSAITTISELIDGDSANFSLPCTPISLEEKLKQAFKSQASADKEILGQALMLTISFMDLCVYKNLQSIAAIAPSRNK